MSYSRREVWPEETVNLVNETLTNTQELENILTTCETALQDENIGAFDVLLPAIKRRFLQINRAMAEVRTWRDIKRGAPPAWVKNTNEIIEMSQAALQALEELPGYIKTKQQIVLLKYVDGLLNVARKIRELIEYVPFPVYRKRAKSDSDEIVVREFIEAMKGRGNVN